MAEGKIDASGNFKLSTFTQGDGALAGEYTIIVMPAMKDPSALAKDVIPDEKPAFPGKYSDPKTSGLKESIKPGKSRSDVTARPQGRMNCSMISLVLPTNGV